jgi:hypothetical protein
LTSTNRYLPPNTLNNLLKVLVKSEFLLIIGKSVNLLPIYGLRLGNGPVKVLMWSQMHGDESTTTRAIIRILEDFKSGKLSMMLNQLSLFIIPQLNPDGAKAFTRCNANDVDLNRDAVDLTQPESVALKRVFDEFKPHFCFNLHGQRTIYAAGKKGKPSTLSFLSPAVDPEGSITHARLKAMQIIVAIKNKLLTRLRDQIGRYDGAFNINCVGDLFMSLGAPTVLFEAGHYPMDYDRDITLNFIQDAIMTGLNVIAKEDYIHLSADEYQQIPENSKDYVDIIVHGVTIIDGDETLSNQSLALQYEEVLDNNRILFQPKCLAYGRNLDLISHQKFLISDLNLPDSIEFKTGRIIKIF